MKINQVAELVGITSKNIRFYEDQGLIKPGRDPENGYRDYTLEDAEQLGRIKLLRQLGIPCETIRRLETGELDFDSCMSDHIARLEKESGNIEHMKAMCKMLSDEVDSISEIKASVYLEKMKELEKGGVRFVPAAPACGSCSSALSPWAIPGSSLTTMCGTAWRIWAPTITTPSWGISTPARQSMPPSPWIIWVSISRKDSPSASCGGL